MPKRGVAAIEKYQRWRRGEGWNIGDQVSVLVNNLQVITNITKISVDKCIVWVKFGFGEISRNVKNVVPTTQK